MAGKRVLIPVQGTKADEEALRLGYSIAKKNKGRVFVIYVIQVKRTLPLDADIAVENVKGEEVLAWAERIAEEEDYEVETDLLQAREIGPAVVDEASEKAVDLIILGQGYKKRFGEFDLGGTTQYVLKNAPCRVWVCREAIE